MHRFSQTGTALPESGYCIWYKKDELVSICGLGDVTGLCGANCYHDYYPVVPGVSEPTYSKDELDELNRKEQEKVSFGGKEYNKYEATQRQRQLETTMRAQREQIKLLKEGGADEDDIIAARARYRATSAEYSRFSETMGIPQQRERVNIDGLGNIGQGKYKADSNKESLSVSEKSQPSSTDSSLTRVRNSSIINSNKGSAAFTEENKTKLLRSERILSDNNYETAVIYNKDGSFSFKKKGKSSEVIFSDDEIAKMEGKTLTHNHPNDSNFSIKDINMMRRGRLQEIRACNKKGAYVLRLRDKWPDELDGLDAIDKAYNEIEDSLLEKHLDLKAQKGLSLPQYIQRLDDDVMTHFAEKYGLDYFWEERTI